MVDDHTLEKISHSGFVSGDILFPECDIFSLVWSSTITPSTKGSMFFFIILNASSKEDFEFLLEPVNQWDTLCTYHYLNKATTTIISTSNIFIKGKLRKKNNFVYVFPDV